MLQGDYSSIEFEKLLSVLEKRGIAIVGQVRVERYLSVDLEERK